MWRPTTVTAGVYRGNLVRMQSKGPKELCASLGDRAALGEWFRHHTAPSRAATRGGGCVDMECTGWVTGQAVMCAACVVASQAFTRRPEGRPLAASSHPLSKAIARHLWHVHTRHAVHTYQLSCPQTSMGTIDTTLIRHSYDSPMTYPKESL